MPIPTKIVNLTELTETRRAGLTSGMAVLALRSRDVVVDGKLIATFATAPDARVMIATHNSADILIEVTRTAKLLESAQAQWRERPGPTTAAIVDSAIAAHRTALARVSL